MFIRKTIFGVLVFACSTFVVWADGAEIALIPVGASGPHAIVGNEIVLHGANQIVGLEIRVSDWGPHRLKAFQAQIDASGAISGDSGTLTPLGWDWVNLVSVCSSDGDCQPGEACWLPWDWLVGYCGGPDHAPETGAFLDEARSDYGFHGFNTLFGVDLTGWDYGGFRYGAMVLLPEEAPGYSPPAKYFGTFSLVVPSDAAGTFTMGFGPDAGSTFLINNVPQGDFILPLKLTPALITVIPADCGNGICDSGEDEISCPADCGPAVQLSMDIRPGTCPNRVNPRDSGIVSVALFGTESVDVAAVDFDSLILLRADGLGGIVTPLDGPPGPGCHIRDVGAPDEADLCACHDSSHDGVDDLVLKFSGDELADALQLASLRRGNEVVLVLKGALLDGMRFEATDCVVIQGPKSHLNPPGVAGMKKRSRPGL